MEKAIQRGSIDNELRNKLWSALKLIVWDKYEIYDYQSMIDNVAEVDVIVQKIWVYYFGLPIDTIPNLLPWNRPSSAYGKMRERFFNGQWWETYDFIEFVAKTLPVSWEKPFKEKTSSVRLKN